LHAEVRLPGTRGLRCMACAGRLPDVVLRRARTPTATCRSTTSCQKCTTPSASFAVGVLLTCERGTPHGGVPNTWLRMEKAGGRPV
jgi:hypothetical protein